jgi:hypothetical protein
VKRPSYQALSYTWGDPEAKVRITLNGRRFLVTPNLDCALRSFRRRRDVGLSMQLPFWIDAICINQEDTMERDEQVRRMKSIYRDAEKVVIWLGNYEEPGDEKLQITSGQWGIELLEKGNESVARQVVGNLHFWTDVLSNHPVGDVLTTSPVIFGPMNALGNPQFWAQVSRLFQRDWFERLWIIQELGAARRAIGMWGRAEIRWECLEQIASYILRPGSHRLGSPPPNILKLFPLIGAHRLTQVSLKNMLNLDTNNILTVLHNTQTTRCSDPRDRLYAILGIVSDTADVDIDYSIPTREVYRNWAEKWIRRTNTLDILSACADSSQSGDLPSWVPDLRSPFGQDKPLWMWAHLIGLQYTRLSRISYRSLAFSEDGKELSITGCWLGRIALITRAGDGVANLRDPTDLKSRLLEIIAGWKDQVSSHIDVDNFGTFHQALLRKDSSTHRSLWDSTKKEYAVWSGCASTLESLSNDGILEPQAQESALKDFERSLFSKLHGCQMFVTETRTVSQCGIVAANCHVLPGDSVAVLDGGLTPFVLRLISATKYRLITPCCLDGQMDWIWFGNMFRDSRFAKKITIV